MTRDLKQLRRPARFIKKSSQRGEMYRRTTNTSLVCMHITGGHGRHIIHGALSICSGSCTYVVYKFEVNIRL